MEYDKGEWYLNEHPEHYDLRCNCGGEFGEVLDVDIAHIFKRGNANAHLIAAAPTHHELLMWIRDRLYQFGNIDVVRDEEIVEQLDVEIAKAENK